MPMHLQREIDKLKKMILAVGAEVEQALRRAIRAVQDRDEALAGEVIEADAEIDRLEIEVEEECLKTLALHQPVAIDLRFIVAVLKINNDLERIGDLAVNIAERAASLSKTERGEQPFDLTGMAVKVQAMLKKSLDALVNLDADLAREVCGSDDEVDEINRSAYAQVAGGIQSHPAETARLLSFLSTCRNLERIADHCTNVAQDVIYMLEGEIVRHRNAGDAAPPDNRSKPAQPTW